MNVESQSEHFTSDEVWEYLAHIHYTGSMKPTIEVLAELQRCHTLSVPFENLSVFGREKIVLSKDWLFDKISRRHRGGFCYELNRLFSLLLDYFGFKHELHAASVFDYKTGSPGPPSHVILAINIENEIWVSDVGFGFCTFPPLRLTACWITKSYTGVDQIAFENMETNTFSNKEFKLLSMSSATKKDQRNSSPARTTHNGYHGINSI